MHSSVVYKDRITWEASNLCEGNLLSCRQKYTDTVVDFSSFDREKKMTTPMMMRMIKKMMMTKMAMRMATELSSTEQSLILAAFFAFVST